jgi:hypothetical protein
MGDAMNDWDRVDTHIVLWVLVAFAAGTAWGPLVDLVIDAWSVDVVTP